VVPPYRRAPPRAGASALLDGLQALDATRSYVPGSLWAGLGNGRGNFTDGARPPHARRRALALLARAQQLSQHHVSGG